MHKILEFKDTSFYEHDESPDDNFYTERNIKDEVRDILDMDQSYYVSQNLKFRNKLSSKQVDAYNYLFEIHQIGFVVTKEHLTLKQVLPNSLRLSYTQYLIAGGLLRRLFGHDLVVDNSLSCDEHSITSGYREIAALTDAETKKIGEILNAKLIRTDRNFRHDTKLFELNLDTSYTVTFKKCVFDWYKSRDGLYMIELDGFDLFVDTHEDDLEKFVNGFLSDMVKILSKEVTYHNDTVERHSNLIKQYQQGGG